MDGRRTMQVLTAVGIVLLPLLLSQQLPSSNTDRSAIPTLLLLAYGFAVGWVRPTMRAWAVLVGGTIAAAVAILASWTDLVLNVRPSIDPVETWRAQAFLAIVGSVASVSAGFIGAAIVRGRSAQPRASSPSRTTVATVAGVLVAVVATSGLTAVVFSRTPLVVQDDQPRVTVVLTDDGLSISPTTVDSETTYRLIYESRATADNWISRVLPLSAADGNTQAMTSTEIDGWMVGDWEALGPRFHYAVGWVNIAPGQRLDGMEFQVDPSSDGSGGVLWYTSAPNALRDWPGDGFDGERPQAPWPIQNSVVVSVDP